MPAINQIFKIHKPNNVIKIRQILVLEALGFEKGIETTIDVCMNNSGGLIFTADKSLTDNGMKINETLMRYHEKANQAVFSMPKIWIDEQEEAGNVNVCFDYEHKRLIITAVNLQE